MRWLSVAVLAVITSACSSSPLSSSDEGSAAGGAGAPAQSVVPSAIDLVPLYQPPANWSATALDFDPTREGELWVTLRQFPSNKPCLESAPSGCAALEGQVALVQGATGDAPSMVIKKDGNAWHFMRRPTAISFGDNGNLGTCGEARTDNYEDEAVDYSGPVLWSSDPAIFGATPKLGQNGTHLDMLHSTPYCMGIAHESENAYWAFNGKVGALDRYDFHRPHQIGGEDHADGELHRYALGELLRVEEVPSHLALDKERRELYVADTGHRRVVRLLIDTGTAGPNVLALDPIEIHQRMDGATLEEVVPPGVLVLPSGITLVGEHLLVTDNETSKIWWFDRDGRALGSVDTGLPPGSLAGITEGPDGALYLSDLLTGNAYRVQPL